MSPRTTGRRHLTDTGRGQPSWRYATNAVKVAAEQSPIPYCVLACKTCLLVCKKFTQATPGRQRLLIAGNGPGTPKG